MEVDESLIAAAAALKVNTSDIVSCEARLHASVGQRNQAGAGAAEAAAAAA